jgi:integrase
MYSGSVMDNSKELDVTIQNPESGGILAEQSPRNLRPRTNPKARRHLPPTHKDYWKPRLEHPGCTRDGRRIVIDVYAVRFQHAGRREGFNLGTSDADAAAAKARDIYMYLKANGWEATLAKFKPAPVTTNKLTVGEYLAAVESASKLRPQTFLNYQNCLHSIIARVFGIKDPVTKDGRQAKYDYRSKGKGNEKWRERLDAIRLEKLTPHLVEKWMKRFVAAAGTSPADIASAKRSANSYVRCARSLFSTALLREPNIKSLTLPNPLPFAGVELFEAGSSKYISKIDARALIAAATRELKAKEPEVYKVVLLGLLCGLRKGEIDLCEWGMVDWDNHILRLEETKYLHLKTSDSAGEITIDPEVVEELRGFKPENEKAKNESFIISSVVSLNRGRGKMKKVMTRIRQPRPSSPRRYYRCEPVFKRLYEWLRNKGVSGNKPLHELRKEIGALIATEHGIFAASTFLRHADITTTARHYVDHKARISVGLGKCLTSSPQIAKPGANNAKAAVS